MEPTPREILIRSVLEIVLVEVLADGTFDAQEKSTLAEFCRALGIPQALFNEVANQIRGRIQPDAEAGSMDPRIAMEKIQAQLSGRLPDPQIETILSQVRRILQPKAGPPPVPAQAPRPVSLVEQAEAREQDFIRLVEESWERFDEVERTGWIDDCFMGNMIAAHVENGRFLLDITSDGVVHYLLFSTQDRDRFVVRMDHSRAEDFAFAKSVGHLTTLTLGVSRAYPDLSKIFSAMKSEFKSNMAGHGRIEGYEDPGVIKVNAEGTTATAETSLLLDLKDYVDVRSLVCDRKLLWDHVSAVYQSLRKYLDGIML